MTTTRMIRERWEKGKRPWDGQRRPRLIGKRIEYHDGKRIEVKVYEAYEPVRVHRIYPTGRHGQPRPSLDRYEGNTQDDRTGQ